MMADEKPSVAGYQIQLNTSLFGLQDTGEGTEFGMFSTVKFLEIQASVEPHVSSDT